MKLTPEQRTAALAMFSEYFVRNYPGPNTIISNPNWHAPKIFRAALHAIESEFETAPAKTVADLKRAYGWHMRAGCPDPTVRASGELVSWMTFIWESCGAVASITANPTSTNAPGVGARPFAATPCIGC